MICGGPVLGSAMPREASWSRSNFSWGTFRCRRPNVTLAASSGFDQPLMIALASSRLLELDPVRSEEHTSELQSRQYLVCRLLLEKKKKKKTTNVTSIID